MTRVGNHHGNEGSQVGGNYDNSSDDTSGADGSGQGRHWAGGQQSGAEGNDKPGNAFKSSTNTVLPDDSGATGQGSSGRHSQDVGDLADQCGSDGKSGSTGHKHKKSGHHHKASGSGDGSGDGSSTDGTGAGVTQVPANSGSGTQGTPTTSAGGQAQSGTGWGNANLDDPQSSATYKGLTLDQMLATPNSLVATEIGNQPDVVAAIRQVSSQYGIPDGLLAATIIEESNGDRTNLTGNSGYGDEPQDQQFDAGLVQAPLWQFPGSTTAEKMQNAEDPVQNLSNFAKEMAGDYQKTGSWGSALRLWNSGDVDASNLSNPMNQDGNPSYVQNILGHLALGASDYGDEGGGANGDDNRNDN